MNTLPEQFFYIMRTMPSTTTKPKKQTQQIVGSWCRAESVFYRKDDIIDQACWSRGPRGGGWAGGTKPKIFG